MSGQAQRRPLSHALSLLPGRLNEFFTSVERFPPEVWNRLGTRLIPKLRSGKGLSVKVEFDMTVEANLVSNAKAEINQVIEDLELTEDISINESSLPEQG